MPVKTVAHNVDIGPGHHRLLAELAKGYQAAPTMAGNLGFTRQTVVRYLSDLARQDIRSRQKARAVGLLAGIRIFTGLTRPANLWL